MKRVVIAGGRDFKDYEKLKSVCDKVLPDGPYEIVSGCEKNGADGLGERYAEEKGWPVKKFHPDWDKFGLKAGPIRNAQMADYGHAAIIFWDGKSRGSKSMIKEMKERNKPVRVINY